MEIVLVSRCLDEAIKCEETANVYAQYLIGFHLIRTSSKDICPAMVYRIYRLCPFSSSFPAGMRVCITSSGY